jgi:hypothetical protein
VMVTSHLHQPWLPRRCRLYCRFADRAGHSYRVGRDWPGDAVFSLGAGI